MTKAPRSIRLLHFAKRSLLRFACWGQARIPSYLLRDVVRRLPVPRQIDDVPACGGQITVRRGRLPQTINMKHATQMLHTDKVLHYVTDDRGVQAPAHSETCKFAADRLLTR